MNTLNKDIGGGGGAGTWLQLNDTPSSYSGQSGKAPRVKGTEDGLEFYTPAGDTDEKVAITSNDSNPGYLLDKLIGTSGKITMTEIGDGGDEDQQVNVGADIMDVTVAGQISGRTEKGTPIAADLLLIDDSADSNNKKKVQIGSVSHNILASKQGGTTDEYYHLTATQHTDLTDAGDSTLHYHADDRSRANHTGTQAASTISDFDTEVSNNTDVAANTTHRGTTTGNPHSVSASDIGLGNVTNDAQIAKSLVNAKGDLIVATADDTPARLAVGTDGQILKSASGETEGVDWVDNEYVMFLTVTGELETGDNQTIPTMLVPFAGTIAEVAAAVRTAPTGSAIQVGLKNAGSDVIADSGNHFEIAASARSGTASSLQNTSVSKNNELTVDIDQIGSTTAGYLLTVRVTIKKS